MESTRVKEFDQLQNEWQEIAKRIRQISLPGSGKRKFDLTNRVLLQHMVRHNPRVRAELANRIPELLVHPFFTLPTTDLETFSVAYPHPQNPQPGVIKNLQFNYATYIDSGVFVSDETGVAVFHSEMMGNLGADYPSIELWYQFPDDSSVLSYEIKFALFLYNPFDDQGANFRLSKREWGGAENLIRLQHLDLSEDSGEGTTQYVSIHVNSTGITGVNGKLMTFKISHDDWQGSHVNWWFYSVKVIKTHFR